ncbi:MAG: 6-phosphogluconolactonase, partial [Candidatus Obscuribacterales bacterium]|nr:6-phosphogluconolactonase [Candidatus Obscuribacterales bacterium]
MKNEPILNVFDDEDQMIEALAERVVDMAADCQQKRGRFVAALSGGNTPRPLYEKLASDPFVERMDWEKSFFFLSDERCVEPTSPESNYAMVKECLVSRAPIPETNIFPTHNQEEDPLQSAADYQRDIEKFFKTKDLPEIPQFDLILLG